jgi:formylglycine-generating enzyme
MTTVTLTNTSIATAMLRIPSGSFLMGSADGGPFESPVHTVFLDEFLIDATLTTNSDFAAFVRATGYVTSAERVGHAWGFHNGVYGNVPALHWASFATPGRELHPVVFVSWHDAAAFAAWAGKRLPTEAEWERAAQPTPLSAGQPAEYPWGSDGPTGAQSNFARPPAEIPPTTPVASFAPNALGLYDMVGNVWQWCSDSYAPDYYAASPAANPAGPSTGETRVRRGGAWNVIQSFRLRYSNRGAAPPALAAPNIGFRCVRS